MDMAWLRRTPYECPTDEEDIIRRRRLRAREERSDRPVAKYPSNVHNVAIGDRRLRGILTDGANQEEGLPDDWERRRIQGTARTGQRGFTPMDQD
jgi:hypothetical protein